MVQDLEFSFKVNVHVGDLGEGKFEVVPNAGDLQIVWKCWSRFGRMLSKLLTFDPLKKKKPGVMNYIYQSLPLKSNSPISLLVMEFHCQCICTNAISNKQGLAVEHKQKPRNQVSSAHSLYQFNLIPHTIITHRCDPFTNKHWSSQAT